MISVLSLEFHTIPGDNTVELKLTRSGLIKLQLSQEKNIFVTTIKSVNFFLNIIETLFTCKH